MTTTEAHIELTKSTLAVGQRLVEMCRVGQYQEAVQELYADHATQIEVMDSPEGDFKRVCEGKAEILRGGEAWAENTEVHGAETGDPYPNGDEFICFMSIDCTSKTGPMAGQRMEWKEMCKYRVADGKIVEAKFFYNPGC
ncbi:MAG: nuclear transport factor 2 family protein [Planctomycetota bacterium]